MDSTNQLVDYSGREQIRMLTEPVLVLLDDIHFIYELVLSQLELSALDVNFEVTNELKVLKLKEAKDIEKLRKRLAYFKYVQGKPTDYFKIIQKNRTNHINQYLTHWIYPYKGKFHPQMVRALLNIIGVEKGDIVLDPFVGSGTTAVETQLLGINCIGIDISPLCVLLSKVKTESVHVLPEILQWKEDIIKSALSSPYIDGKEVDKVISLISNEKVRDFYRVAKLLTISDITRRRLDFTGAFLKNLEMMINSISDYVEIVCELGINLGEVDIKVGDARELPLNDDTIDGIVTSPPYSIALDYVTNDAHALKELGFNLSEIREVFVGVRGKGKKRIELYNEDMKKALEEMYRVLKPNKYAVIVVGNATYMGKEIKTVEFIIDYAEKIGFKLINNINKVIFGLYNMMKKENILIFKKCN